MADPSKPTPKGRASLLLSLLRQAEESKPGGDGAATSSVEPPKPRGRAALLQRMAEMSTKPGSGSGEPSGSKPVAEVTKKLAQTTLESKSEVPTETAYYKGTAGNPLKITANYIRLKVEPNRGVFVYDLKFDPPVDSKSFRIKILNMHMPQLGKIKMFDGGTQLYLPIRLPDAITQFTCKHPQTEEDVTMTVTYIKQKKLGDCLQLYNILFKRVMHAILYSRIGRNYFSPSHAAIIPQHKLEILPGYVIAADEYEGGIMLCLDVQHRVLRTQSVLELFREYHSTYKQRFKEVAQANIIGSSVLTRYNNKNYTIDDIVWDASPKDTFKTYDDREISYIEYYKKQHNIEIHDLNQPLLLNKQTIRQVGTLEKVDRFICLIPEICYMTGLTDEMRSDFKVMKDVAQYTRVTPNQRMNSLRKYLENVANSADAQKILKDWGLELDSATIDLQARVLDCETILFGQGIIYKCNSNADWNTAVMKNKLLGPIDLLSWIIVYTERDSRVAKEFAENMRRLAGPMGNRISPPQMHLLPDDRTESYVRACKNVISSNVQVLVFICPTMRSDRYSAIKKMCCAEMPISSQVVLSRTLQNQAKVRPITQKIAYQINCKLGGCLWSVRFPFKNWMIIGIDVYHSKSINKSVCALVASMNESITNWYNQAVYQEREIGDHLKYLFIKCLEKYRATNGVFPKKIVVFRDGVGDGQLQHCKQYEIPQFESCIKEFDIQDCNICYVIVQKRINTRLFSKGDGGLENPAPGSILDHTVTRKQFYDFFLVSQHVRQGTVTPTHYIVLHDACNLQPDHVQKLSYKLCHLYYNWPGTIRVPAPCQYAHKLAYLVGQHVGKIPSQELNDKLFYL